MTGIHALQRRVVKLEQAGKPRPSPFTIWLGSMVAFVDAVVVPGIQNGLFDAMETVVAAVANAGHFSFQASQNQPLTIGLLAIPLIVKVFPHTTAH